MSFLAVDDETLLAGKARYDGELYGVVVTAGGIECVSFDTGKQFTIHMVNVYGVEKSTHNGKFKVVVHTFVTKGRDAKHGDPFKGVDKHAGFSSSFKFVVQAEEEQNEWVEAINYAVNVSMGLPKEKKRKFLIVVNPFGGRKLGKKIYQTKVWPFFKVANVEIEMILTAHANHAVEIGQKLELNKYDVVATVSGDGLLHQVLNGLLDRPDWNKAIQSTVFGIIPAGTSNALAKNIDCEVPEAAAFNLIKGKGRPLDIMAMHQEGHTTFSHLSLTHGLIADIDVGSDNLRYLGPARLTVAAIRQMIKLPRYPVKLAYLTKETVQSTAGGGAGAGAAAAAATIDTIDSDAVDTSASKPAFKYDKLTFDTIPADWVKRETSLMKLTVSNPPWIDTDYLNAPNADFSDGFADVVLIEKATTAQVVPYFTDTESGQVTTASFAEYFQVAALYLEPEKGLVAIDGELIPTKPVILEMLPQFMTLVAPPELVVPPSAATGK